ncbi:MAG: hypothetical protein H6587_11400 [Flavobacteriales bacterium]|nr:hypothetical protein [Flavobacteriales bacterium]
MSKKEQISETSSETNYLSNSVLLILTVVLSLVYFGFSSFSNGFYMHDEVSNFLGMQGFWSNPMSILGANSKTGYKLFFILPALGGYTVLQLFNSFLAGFTVFFSYKVLQQLKSKHSLLIFFLLGIQPLWFMLSFRSYTEVLVAFLLVLSAYQHFNKKYIYAALILSYIAFTRQELHVISGLYFIYLVAKKQWIPALLTGLFTVINFLIGFALTGDILNVVKEIIKYSEQLKDAYPRQGFDHYFLMSSVIFGVAVIILFFSYLGGILLQKKKPEWIILIPVVAIFLLNCAFNAQFMEFSIGNGGNLRYLLTISPFISILSVLSFDSLEELKPRWKIAFFLLPLLLLIAVFQTFDHNFIKFNEEIRVWTPFIFALLTSIVVLLPLKTKQLTVAIGILSIAIGMSIIDTRQIQPEEQTVKKAAKWFNNQVKISKNPQPGQQILITEDSRLSVSHTLFYFYAEKNESDFKKTPVPLIKESTDTLKVGDLVVWDSHYGYRPKLRPGSQPYEYYEKDPRFQKIQYYQSKDRRFTIVFFLKVKE